ncbi:MAG: DUF2764 domain-containing protein [Bacteroidaceae bacterium]|nr:DUF2764 domain-containing protein [Bacteroidaceae bacterium]
MKKNYYYLIAGLPELSLDDSKLGITVREFRELYYPELADDDRALLDLIYLSYDNANLLTLLKDKEAAIAEGGLYTSEELLGIIEAARAEETPDRRYPRYMYDFVAQMESEESAAEGIFPEDRLAQLYYAHAMSQGNVFVERWFAFNLDLNNFLTAITARRYNLDVKPLIVGDNEVAKALRTSNSRDFGLTGVMDGFEEVMRISEIDNLVERERKLDVLKWEWMEENSFFDYFTVEKLFAFLVKIQIIERWITLDAEAGGEMLRGMIRQLKEEVKVPQEFTINNKK